ncbi:MAG: D-alanyl-D-alanine carboxypeptidase [Actinobacteria bacterium]|nr:D-alanyl-D-alanine carboxypeptidase [Actinomycetota bacterium]
MTPLRRARRRSAVALLALFGALALLPASGLAQSPSPAPSPSLEAPPPTPVVGPGGQISPSPFPTSLRTPSATTATPSIEAASAILADLATGRVLFASNPDERRPIASVTKIMTALVVLERADPDDVVTVSEEAAGLRVAGISGLGLQAGERIRVRELLYALLLQSANDAAEALAEHVSGSVDAFVDLMNARSVALGLTRTRFDSPNGLDDVGYSTARDLVRLTRAAYDVPGFAELVATRSHTVRSPMAGPRIVQNRNALLWLYPGAIGVKTGFTTPAGFCLVAAAERDGERLLVVVLGEPGEPFSDAATLLNYGFAAFERRTLLEHGASLGTVEVAGRDVAVSAGGSVSALVAIGAGVERTFVLHERVAYPPPLGEVIGGVRLSAAGRRLGEVPLVVAEVPPPPPPDAGSWWGRALGAVAEAADAVLEGLLS